MLGDTFKEELKKNNVLYNKSNKFGKLFFKSFSGEKIIKLYGAEYLSYGYIYAEIENANPLKLFYKDILISCLSGNKSVIIPLAFENGSNLTISGSGDDLKILIFGSKCRYYPKNYLLPNFKILVRDCGVSKLLSYNSKEDIINNNLSEIKTFDNLYSSQTYMENDNVYCGCLYKNSNVYFCTSKDNYANSVFIDNDITDGVVVPTNLSTNIVAYIKNGEIYYNYLENNVVKGAIKIERTNNARPLNFIPVEVDTFGCILFGVVWNNGYSSIYVYDGNKFVNKLTFKGDKCKFIINEDQLEIVKVNDYSISSSKFSIGKNILPNQNVNGINKMNINEVFKVGNSYLCFNDGVCTEVNFE